MFDGKYIEWNQKRIKGIVDFYGHKFFYYKKVLDLGCGYADISCVLHRLGSDITAVDARQEHLRMVAKKYPGIKTVKADLDREWPFVGKPFDLILDLDLICHLNNYEQHLRSVCASCTHLILETAVCDSEDPNKSFLMPENKNIYDLSMNGVGCRPSAAAIERVLLESNMNFRRVDVPKYNSGNYTYDWVPQNNDDCDINKRRMWFAIKNTSPIKFSPNVNDPLPQSPIIIPTVGSVPALHNSSSPMVKNFAPTISSISPSTGKQYKVALCLSGHLRTFERCYKALLDNLIVPLKPDIFIHTWQTIGSENSKGGTDQNSAFTTTKSKLREIESFYSPKKLKIEPFDKGYFFELANKVVISERDKIYVAGHLGYHFAMFYSIKMANDLKCEFENENNFKYDYVIRMRPDMLLETRLSDQFFPSNSNSISIPIIAQYHEDGMNDQMAIGSSKNMDTYCDFFNHKLQYCQSRVRSIRPESLLRYHVTTRGLIIEKKPIQYALIRFNGDILRQP